MGTDQPHPSTGPLDQSLCFGHAADHGAVVLKISGPHNERFTEIEALERYGGHLACRALEVDYDSAAVLLEKLNPGMMLKVHPDVNERLRIGTEMIAKLPIPVDREHGFPDYADWVDNAARKTRAAYRPPPRMDALIDSMVEIFHEICPPGTPGVLLHGDLHHENILQAGDSWKIIDPQGVIGPAFMESARFIQNHVINDDGLDHHLLTHTVTYIAEHLGETKRSIAAALFILNVLSTCWGLEMNYEDAYIEGMIRQCEEMLAFMQGV